MQKRLRRYLELAGFLKKAIKLLLFFVVAVTFQVKIIPWMFPDLRIDIFLCFVISLCIFARFPHGLLAVIIASFALQAFSGAKPGYLPITYTICYFLLDMIKYILFVDTIPAQMFFCFILSLLMAATSKFFYQISLADVGILSILASSALTAAICPIIVKYSGRILVRNEN